MTSIFSISDAHVLAVLAGVLFGSAAISTGSWVWLKKQIFAFGGSALCGSGVVLLGLSIWHSVEFGVSSSSISLKLQAELNTINARIAQLDQGLQQSSVTLADVRQAIVATQAVGAKAQTVAGNSSTAGTVALQAELNNMISAKIAAIDQALAQLQTVQAKLVVG